MLHTHLDPATQISQAGNVTIAAAITAGIWLWLGTIWLGLRLARRLLPRKRPRQDDLG